MSIRTSLILALVLAGATAGASAQGAPAASAPAPVDSNSCCRMKSEGAAGPCRMMPGEHQGAHRMEMSHQPGARGMGMGGAAGMGMPMPSAADQARLDSLVAAMHQSKGDRKLAAMEKIIDDLMAHRKAMMEHMQSMNDRRAAGPCGEAEDHSQHH